MVETKWLREAFMDSIPTRDNTSRGSQIVVLSIGVSYVRLYCL